MQPSYHSPSLEGASSRRWSASDTRAPRDFGELATEIRRANEQLILAVVSAIGRSGTRAKSELKHLRRRIYHVTRRLSAALVKVQRDEIAAGSRRDATRESSQVDPTSAELFVRDPAGFSLQALTRRERQVLQLLAEGASNKEVGGALGISTKTAETHRARIMKKLQVHSMNALTRFAIRNHVIDV